MTRTTVPRMTGLINSIAVTQPHGSLAKEYRELLDLRERVRKAEAAAAERLIRPRKSQTRSVPVGRL